MKRLSRKAKWFCSFLGVGILAAFLLSALPWLNAQDKRDFRPQKLLAPLPPITEFPTKSVRDAREMLNPSELVIGVTVGKESRAYPINMLTGPQREILNDKLGGKAIAATW